MRLLLSLLFFIGAGLAASPASNDPFRLIPMEASTAWVHYIVPNEADFSVFDRFYKSARGALITEGTFRAFHAVSMGDFSHVFIVDYDAAVIVFDQHHIGELILKAKNRLDYFSRLFGSDAIAEKFRDFEHGKIGVHELTDAVTEHLQKELPWENQINQLMKEAGVSLLPGDARKYAESMLRFYLTALDGFLKSDVAFDRLQATARNGRIHLIQGSQSGDRTMPALAETLKSYLISVSVADVSNVEGTIVGEHPEEHSRWVENLSRLPWGKDARLLFTYQARYVKSTEARTQRLGEPGYWRYYAVSPLPHLKAAAQFAEVRYSERVTYGKYLDSLEGSPADLNRSRLARDLKTCFRHGLEGEIP